MATRRRCLLLVSVLATLATFALTGCGSDAPAAPKSDGGAAASSGTTAATTAGGELNGPCDVTDQATVASVFPGAGAGRAGQVRNCEYSFSSGPVTKVNVFLYDGVTLAQFSKQDEDNGITFTSVRAGDAAIRDQLHTVTVQQGDVLFSVQALPRSGVAGSKLAEFDPQVLALADKIATNL